MKVLQLLPGLDYGGMELMVINLARGLRARGIVSHLGELVHRGAIAPGDVFASAWCGNLRVERGIRDIACHYRLYRFLARGRFDLVHVHNTKACAYIIPAAILTGTPVVYTLHGQGAPEYRYDYGLSRVNRLAGRTVSKCVAVSDSVIKRLVADGVKPEKVNLIRNGVDTAYFQHNAVKDGARSKKQILIGTVGRLAQEKNYGLLFEAFSKLCSISCDTSGNKQSDRKRKAAIFFKPGMREVGGQYQLMIVGEGSERAKLEAKARDLKIENRVCFAGMQPDTRPYYEQMDIFVLSSSTEGMPMTLLEAGACGLPCVVTDVGGCGEVVEDGLTGLVASPGNVAELSSALGKLANNSELRGKMGLAARARVEKHYSLEKMVKAYEKVYCEAIGE